MSPSSVSSAQKSSRVSADVLAAGADEERMHVELFSPNDWLLPGA